MLPWTYTPESLVSVSGWPTRYESGLKTGNFTVWTDDIELEGEYSFSFTLTGPNGEYFEKDFVLEVLDNPCEPLIDTTDDELLIETELYLDAGMTTVTLDYSQNGNCRYNVTLYEADCTRPVASTGVLLNEPLIIFEKEPFIEDTDDDRIVTMAGSDFFTIDVPAKMASNVTSFPDTSDYCFQVLVAPENSPQYTTTVSRFYHYTFLLCDPVFQEDETVLKEYTVTHEALEIYHTSKDSSRCSDTTYTYELRREGVTMALDPALITVTLDNSTRSINIEIESEDVSWRGTYQFVIIET